MPGLDLDSTRASCCIFFRKGLCRLEEASFVVVIHCSVRIVCLARAKRPCSPRRPNRPHLRLPSVHHIPGPSTFCSSFWNCLHGLLLCWATTTSLVSIVLCESTVRTRRCCLCRCACRCLQWSYWWWSADRDRSSVVTGGSAGSCRSSCSCCQGTCSCGWLACKPAAWGSCGSCPGAVCKCR